MKKVFSLLLVVAMLVSMAVVASATEPELVKGMKHTITETDADITVTITIGSVVDCSGFVSFLQTDKVTYVNGSARVLDARFDIQNNVPNASSLKFACGMASEANWIDESGEIVIAEYKVAKVNSDYELSAADFAYGTNSIKASKVITGSAGTVDGIAAGPTNFGTHKPTSAPYFTIEYVDERTSAPADEFVNDTSSAVEGTTITCAGRVGAEYLSQRYGVEFTAESTVGGNRPQVFYGAKPGDTVGDYQGSTTFVFDDWDGTFEIILQGVHAGTKSFRFFVGSDYTDLSSKVVSE